MITRTVKALYENGHIRLLEQPPINLENTEISVIFNVKPEQKERTMSKEEAFRILKKYARRLPADFDYEKERDAYLEEKYGPFN